MNIKNKIPIFLILFSSKIYSATRITSEIPPNIYGTPSETELKREREGKTESDISSSRAPRLITIEEATQNLLSTKPNKIFFVESKYLNPERKIFTTKGPIKNGEELKRAMIFAGALHLLAQYYPDPKISANIADLYNEKVNEISAAAKYLDLELKAQHYPTQSLSINLIRQYLERLGIKMPKKWADLHPEAQIPLLEQTAVMPEFNLPPNVRVIYLPSDFTTSDYDY